MIFILDGLGNVETVVKIWTRRPFNYHKNISNNTRTNMESSLNILFSYMRILNFENVRMLWEAHPLFFDEICSNKTGTIVDTYLYKFGVYLFRNKFVEIRIGNWYMFYNKTFPNAWTWISHLSKMRWGFCDMYDFLVT